MAKAVYGVVVDHARRLHVGVANGGANKLKPALLKIFAHRIRGSGAGGHLGHGGPGILHSFALDKLPNVAIKAAEALLHLQKRLGVEGGGGNFETVAHNARILQKLLVLGLVVASDDRRVKAIKGGAEVFALAQNGEPAQPGLKAIENDELEVFGVVVNRHPPLGVVVGDFNRVVVVHPAAAG